MTARVIERLIGNGVTGPGHADGGAGVRVSGINPAPELTDQGSRSPAAKPKRAAGMFSRHVSVRHTSDRPPSPPDAGGASAVSGDADRIRAADEPFDAVGAVASLLRQVAPRLLSGAGPAAAERFAGLVVRRLARDVDAAIATLNGGIGRAAAGLAPVDRQALEHAVLTARLDRERAIGEAAAALAVGDLLALLFDAASSRGPDTADALRCRRLVFGDGEHAAAREAALDLATDQPDERRTARIVRAVAPVFRASVPTVNLSADAVRCLDAIPAFRTDAGAGPPPAPALTTGVTAGLDGALDRRGDEGSFARALFSGDADGAARVLAHAAGCSPLAIRRAMHGRDAETLISLVWRADFAADLAAPAQIVLGRIPPGLALTGRAPGDFPLATAAMASLCRALA